MWCKGRVFRRTRQGANFIVVIVGLILIFKKQLTSLVNKAFSNINDKAGTL
ncbi:Flp1 family type IVb pilin [Eubacterium ramulus]